MSIINLDEFIFYPVLKITRVEYHHNDSGLEMIEVCECSCKVVYNYAHLDRSTPPPHYTGCPALGCNGVMAQACGSSYIFPCEDHNG